MKDNLLLKLVSLLAAILLAYSVNSDRNTSVLTFNVPIELKNPPDDKVLLRPSKRMAQVTLRGPAFLVGPMASSPPPFRVMVPSDVGERFQVSLRPDDLSVPSMIEVLSVEPPEIEFVFEPLDQRELKVEVPRVGHLPKQVTLSKFEVNPRTAVVKGPRSEIRQIRFVESEPIDLEDISESQSLKVSLRNPGNLTTLVTKTVEVAIQVDEMPRQRVFEARPVELRLAPTLSAVEIEPTEVVVLVQGAAEVVNALDPGDVLPYVRVKDAPPSEGRLVEVRVELPDGCKVVKIDPPSINVFAQKNRASQPSGKSGKSVKKSVR